MSYKKSTRRVNQINPDTSKIIRTWDSLNLAASAFMVTGDDISQVCKRNEHYRGREHLITPKLLGGYRWEFAPEIIETHTEQRYRVDNEDGTIGNMVYKKLELAEKECRLKNRYRVGWSVTSWDVEVAVKVG